MKLRMPRYFSDFRCLAGACPDTCCRDWEITLDEAALADYRTLEGPLGEAVRAAMAERDGETVLALAGGDCPLLDRDGLCRIQRALGEARLCRSCALHPRFAEEYGALQEWCLSLSCPEAARMILSERAPMTFVEAVDDEPVHGCNDPDARLFYALLSARRAAFAMLQDRTVPWQTRLARLLAFASAWQRKLNQHRIGELDAVTARFAAGRFPRTSPGTDPAHGRRLLRRLQALEPVNAAWPALLASALAAEPAEPADFGPAAEQLLVYWVYRYFLKAVTDRRLLPRVQAGAVMTLCVRALADGAQEEPAACAYRFSRNVEHSPENMETLLRWCEGDEDFSAEALIAAC